MKYFRLIILAIEISLIAACSNFLEEKSQDEVIPKSAMDFREILLHYQATPFTPVIYMLDDDVELDEYFFYPEDEDYYEAMNLEACLTWQPDIWERANTLANNYEETYKDIMGMNAILAEIDDATGSLEEKELVKAQALAMRAYHYFMLVNTYGEPYNQNKDALGVVLKLEVPYVEGGMERATVGDVYNQIVEDLETASALLNKYPKTRGDYLMNSTSTDILLSRVYLYMEEWDKAVEAATRAINSAEGLVDYNTLPGIEYSFDFTYDISEVECLFGTVAFPSPSVKPTSTLISLFDVNDKRLERLTSKFPWNDGYNPTVWIRLAEAFLNRAEARVLAELQDLTGALEDLNKLRRYRISGYADESIVDAEMLLMEIREERRKELCFEGHRWFDLRRYGMPSITRDFRTRLTVPLLRYTLQENDPLYTLPFPRVALENNNRLEQNASALAPERVGVPIQ